MTESLRVRILDFRFFHPARLFGNRWFLWPTLVYFSLFLLTSIVFPPISDLQGKQFTRFIELPEPLPRRTRIYQLEGISMDASLPLASSGPMELERHILNYPYWMLEVILASSVISACIIKLNSNKKIEHGTADAAPAH